MVARADIVICGGGIVGATLAYALSLRGIRALVVERESAAHGASGTAAGILSPPSPALAKQPGGQLSARGIALHRELAEELNGAERWDYRPLESAVVARNKDEVRELERAYGKDAVGQVQSPWADKNAMAAVPLEGAAQLDPGKFTHAMLEAACANGAEVMTGDVQGIRTEQGSVTGVQVSAGTVETGRVVVAMGPWASESEGWLRTPVPVTPLKGQILHLDIPYAPDAAFSTLDGNYAVRKPSGVVYAGTTEEDTGFDRSWTEEALDGILGWARGMSSQFQRAKLVGQTACLRPLSRDELPLLGRAPAFEGAYLATGHGRKGIAQAPSTALAMAELIDTGECTAMDLAPFDPARFAARSPR